MSANGYAQEMKPTAALKFAADAAADGRVEFSYHATFEEMPAERVSADDVLNVLLSADEAVQEDDAGFKWKLYGSVINGDDLAVVVRFRRDRVVVIVTVHPVP